MAPDKLHARAALIKCFENSRITAMPPSQSLFLRIANTVFIIRCSFNFAWQKFLCHYMWLVFVVEQPSCVRNSKGRLSYIDAKISHVMRKTNFAYAKNKGANQRFGFFAVYGNPSCMLIRTSMPLALFRGYTAY